MTDFLAVTNQGMDPSLFALSRDVSVRGLTNEEQVAIEDFVFKSNGKRISIPENATAVSLPDKLCKGTSVEEFAKAVEFGLSILCKRGNRAILVAASFDGARCKGTSLAEGYSSEAGIFSESLTGQALCEWLALLFAARQKLKDHMHVTADRFVRYCRGGNSTDSLLDLCICLESLIDAETEIAFRFSVCLAKVGGGDNASAVCELLSHLYNVRSKVVHGVDPKKAYSKLMPNLSELHDASRTILTKYVIHLAAHGHENWNKHLKGSLLAQG